MSKQEKLTMILRNGPLNGAVVSDLGDNKEEDIRIPLETRSECGSIGPVDTGLAVYEPTEDRREAFWSHNVWGVKNIRKGRDGN